MWASAITSDVERDFRQVNMNIIIIAIIHGNVVTSTSNANANIGQKVCTNLVVSTITSTNKIAISNTNNANVTRPPII